MINILFFFLLLNTSNRSHGDDVMNTALKENMDLERQLKLINKPPVKSFHTKFGDIIDCIDINKQPAFDHPLLKNHKLQRGPSFRQTMTKARVNNSLIKTIVGLNKGSCPRGTVPIRRTIKSDLIRVKSLLNNVVIQDNSNTHVAEVSLGPSKPFYGVQGINSVYNPRVYKDQSSASHVWVQNGEQDGINKIIAGWHVFPQLYGNDATHLYALWTTDNFKKTGCYNMLCDGFVQVDKDLHIGARVDDTSVYGGLMRELSVSISQDPTTKHWWLTMSNKNVGYFPASLFPNLATANRVGWGGKTIAPEYHPSPPMGSGYFPDDNLIHACYFRQVTYRNELRQDKGPEKSEAQTFTDHPACFGVTYDGDQGRDAGYSLQFGGPGGNCAN